MFLLLSLIILFLIWKWWQNTRLTPRFPPGPLGAPVLGHIPTILNDDFLKAFHLLHAKYGKVLSINLGPGPRTVIIGDFDVLKEG